MTTRIAVAMALTASALLSYAAQPAGEPPRFVRYVHEPFNNLSFEIVRGWEMRRFGDEFVFSFAGAFPELSLQTVRKSGEYINVWEFVDFQIREEGVSPRGLEHLKVRGFDAVEYTWAVDGHSFPVTGRLLAVDVGQGILQFVLLADARYDQEDASILENVKHTLVFEP